MSSTAESMDLSARDTRGDAGGGWRFSLPSWVLLGLAAVLLIAAYWDPLVELERLWSRREEYSHGYFIPLISIFLVWQRQEVLRRLELRGSWMGWLILLGGIAMYFMGNLAALYVVMHYSIIVVLFGLALAFAGWQGMRYLWVPVLFLFFMVPLPPFLYNNLSQKLQLISSELGVAVIRFFGISVYLEGNVIDLGSYKLQVVEACNGLRYLFPLMSFGFLAAYFFSAPLWQRVVVFLSTIPITVLMNSFRIGVIGVLVDRWGTEQAEGFLHDFEGWVIFMACVGILLVEMWFLNRFFSRDKRPFREVFGIDMPAPRSADEPVRLRPLSWPMVASVVLLAGALAGTLGLGQRVDLVPERREFVDFPAVLGEWQGRRDVLEDIYLDALDLDDYIIANYTNPAGAHVNFYVAWYDNQRAGGRETAHSPRSCIPGGGWEIQRLSRVSLDDIQVAGVPLKVNRVQIAMGDNKQLVYYWFQQRGRVITSEYAMKWYLFWDALTRNRSDGALVRLTTAARPGESWEQADARLTEFARVVAGRLQGYIPE